MPVSIKGSGGGSVTLDAGSAASDTTLTLPNSNGTVLTTGSTVPVANGGTGATTAAGARTNLGTAASGANSDITSLSGLTTALSAAQGGTGITAPGTSGNVLTSNGSAWISSPPSSVLPSATAIGQALFSTNGTTFTPTQKIAQGTAVASTSGTSIDFTGIPSWVKRVTVMFNGVSTSGTSAIQIQVGTSSGFVTSGYSSLGAQSSNVLTTSTTGLITMYQAIAANFLNGMASINLFSGNTWVFNSLGGYTDRIVFSGGVTPSLASALDRIRITTINGTDTFDAGSINIMYE